MKNKRILIIAAHPDDEVLGCGGTIARLTSEGCEAYTLILGEGSTSRSESRNRQEHAGSIESLKHNLREASRIIGVKEAFSFDFPDNRFDGVELLDIVKVIEKIKNEISPDMVFTHASGDLNIDHGITHKAVLTATRPVAGEPVRELLTFSVLSSTEWMFPESFTPDVFFDISKTVALKKKAMERYVEEVREFPHPRSLEGIEVAARNCGMRVGLPYAEGFKTIRSIR